MDELIDTMKKIDAVEYTSEDYLYMNSKYEPIKIELTNFHKISLGMNDVNNRDNNNTQDITLDKNILFVDGGNSVLFESASFCIGMIRVGVILYSKNIRVSRKSREFRVLVRIKNGEYSVNTYPKTSFDGMQFNPEDDSLRDGIEKCTPSKILSVIRRLAEIETASEYSADADFILMDGTLEARYPSESKYLDKLMSTGKACALSKTCNLITKNGESIVRKLTGIVSGTEMDTWYYYPIVKNNNPLHKSEIYFVKLHPNSAYTFRFEIQHRFKGTAEQTTAEEVFTALVINSKDPVFIGYPYGLIDVDQYARITEEESSLMRTKLSVKMGKQWNEFSKNLTSTNAHTILDKIRF